MYEKELFIFEKAFNFARRIIKLYKYLRDEKKEYILSNQLLRSGTSIGANIKEASESEYWIELLRDEYLTQEECDSLIKDLIVIIKMLTTSIKKISSKK